MTGFSTIPLQVASLLGFVFSLFGFFILAYVLIRYLMDGSPMPGFPFLASIIAIFSGVQLFALGIIGEYLARIHFRSMDRPAYVVAETIKARLMIVQTSKIALPNRPSRNILRSGRRQVSGPKMPEGGKPLTAFLTCTLYGSNPGYESVRRVTLGYRVKPPKKIARPHPAVSHP